MHSSGGVEIIRVFLRSRQAGICRAKAALPDASFGFDTSGKTLAEWHHRKFVPPARSNPPRVFSCWSPDRHDQSFTVVSAASKTTSTPKPKLDLKR
jgi:hypothetical protein